MEKDNYKKWITPTEFEQIYSISKSTQAKLRMQRKLPFSKFSKFIRYNRDDINTLFDNHIVISIEDIINK